MSALRVSPITVSEARAVVARWHSHHAAPVGGLFAVSVRRGEDIVCVAIIGRPVARAFGNTSRGIAEVTRVASDGAEHAASMCIAAAARMAIAGGYRRVVSYTLIGEAGTSYRAAGWVVTGLVPASQGWHSRDGRTTMQGGAKVWWETGPDAEPANGAAALVVGMCAGRVEVPSRRETLPLLAGLS